MTDRHLVGGRLSLLRGGEITDEVHAGWTGHADPEALSLRTRDIKGDHPGKVAWPAERLLFPDVECELDIIVAREESVPQTQHM